ncbi:MAG: hypothetical protein H6981_05315 [Gammaproteobacteria bacterium]|nr:hypothetical protein [Gammaproteobacteria bacterium]MCP5136201.1 hypothetical protein [Gammaproteobacteria bacterium]
MSIPGTEIYRVRDEEGAVVVYDSTEIRILAFDSPVEQSCVAKSRPWRLQYAYTQTMMLGALFTPQLKHAAVLGLGGGSQVRALRHGWPDLRITAVEKRAAVAQVAKDWFLLDDDPRLGIVIGDAGEWLHRPGASQDLLFADLYDNIGMDAQQADMAFLTGCARRLGDGGVLVLNRWSANTDAARRHKAAIAEVFGDRVLMVSVQGGNNITFAFQGPIPALSRRAFMDAAQTLGLRLDIPLQRHARRLWDENTPILK